MTSVQSSDAQSATGHGSATVPGSRDEEALPRSESGIERIKPKDYDDIIQLNESLRLNDTNWVSWRVDMIYIFGLCGVEGYVKGTLPRPDPNIDPKDAENWSFNDKYTRLIISLNITQSQKNNTLRCNSAHEVWTNLEFANRSQVYGTYFGYGRKLSHTTAGERDDIVGHLEKLKEYRQQVDSTALCSERLQVSDNEFNLIIARSLPSSWDYFTDRYVGSPTFIDDDPGVISSQQFVEVIKQEYRRREECYREYVARKPKNTSTLHCRLCKKHNHNTERCYYLGQPRCDGCGRFGHDTSECRNNKRKKRKYEDD